jgi:hypothetical protein
LKPGGRLLLEPSTFAAIHALGLPGPSWYAAQAGLWSARPHLVLQDNAWDAATSTAVERYVVVDAATGDLAQYGMTTRAFQPDELAAQLAEIGFEEITVYPSLLGRADHPFAQDHAGFYAVLAQKPG